MNFKHYQTTEKHLWENRKKNRHNLALNQFIEFIDLESPITNKDKSLSFAILGFASDEGILRNSGRIGAKEGPDAIRLELANLSLHRKNINIVDAGTITCNDKNLETSQTSLAKAVHILLDKNYIPILIGGGHEIAWGHYQGINQKYPYNELEVINLDAHFDMRPLLANKKGTSGTPFLQIAIDHKKTNKQFNYNCIGIQPACNSEELYSTAKKYNVNVLNADKIFFDPNSSLQFINKIINKNNYMYFSLCLDVISSAFAPGVSAPQPLGLMPNQIIDLIRRTATSGKVISYDIAELSPKYDIDCRTAKLAASFIYEIIHCHTKIK